MRELNHFKSFLTEGEYETYMSDGPELPNVSVVNKKTVHFTNGKPVNPYLRTPLTIEITEGSGNMSIHISDDDYSTMYYKLNNGIWTEVSGSYAGVTLNVSVGDKIQLKGNVCFNYSSHDYSLITNTDESLRYIVYGNIMSMLYENNFVDKTVFPDAPGQASNGYFKTYFYDCTGLTSAENLMLPATALTDGCYSSMFNGCSLLTKAPVLPATTLSEDCYIGMFRDCTSLETAPELPARTLTPYCYFRMFDGCSRLNSVKCLATNKSATECTTNWLRYVASNGTFVKNPNMSSWTRGVNGIPNNWTIEDAS